MSDSCSPAYLVGQMDIQEDDRLDLLCSANRAIHWPKELAARGGEVFFYGPK